MTLIERPRVAPQLSSRLEQREDFTLLSLHGDFDLHTSPSLKRLASSDEARRDRRLIVDMTGITFFDCSAVNVLMTLHARLRGQVDMAIVCPAARWSRIFRITEMDRFVPVAASVRDALAALDRRASERGVAIGL